MYNSSLSSEAVQQSRLFRVYNHYRLVISLMLVGLLFLDLDLMAVQSTHLVLYQSTALAYLALNAFVAFLLMAGFHARRPHINLSILIDIAVLHALVLLSGGVDSGMTNLVVIAVAAANILSPYRLGIFYAALATLATLAIAAWNVLIGLDGLESTVRAGFLGLAYFAVAFVLQHITRRLIHSEALARERAESIAELEQLNHQIIQRMRTGILVCTSEGSVRLVNEAAGELLTGQHDGQRQLPRLPQPLLDRLQQWLRYPETHSSPFRAQESTPQLQANFARLGESQGSLILIFLEDTSKITQQAQQIKLASLGRLTAGIAHEIRNPLGAISHAAQLLAESPHIQKADLKMTDIIQRHSRRVNAIVENVLELSRRRAPDMETTDLADWLPSVIESFRESSDHRCDAQLEVHDRPALARFDRSQLTQVLTNLMDNGARYSQQRTGHSRIQLTCGVTEDQQRAYVDVVDEGPGLDDAQQRALFEPFFTTEAGGTGLGLYLGRELCEANQAQLTLMNPEAGQCRFRITFAHPRQRPYLQHNDREQDASP